MKALALAGLALAGITATAIPASAGTSPVVVNTPAVRVTDRTGYVKLTVRFGECVRNVRAFITSGDDGPDNTRYNRLDREEKRSGTTFTVYVGITPQTAQAMPGTWYVSSVQADACSGNPSWGVGIYYPNPVFQVTS